FAVEWRAVALPAAPGPSRPDPAANEPALGVCGVAPSFDANHPLTAASMSSITSACVEAGSPTMQMLAGAPPLCGPPPLGGPPPAGGPPPLGGPPPVFGPATKVPPTFMGAPPP